MGSDGGVAQLLYKNYIDINAAGGLLRIERIDYYTYLIPYLKFR